MFEKEIKFISDFTINKLKTAGSSFSVEKLELADIHPAVIRFVSAEIDLWIFEDRKKLLQDSKFDYSGNEINRLFSQISREIKKTKKIQLEELSRLIVRAVSFNVNFVVRPNWSLLKFIFENSDTMPVDEINQRLDFIYYYDFLRDILISYFDKRKIKNISRTELDLILKKIDRELIASSGEKIIRKSLEAMADFFNIGAVNTNRVWPTYVEIFLKEKDLLDHLLKLHKAIPADKKQKMDIEEIFQILYSDSKPDESKDVFIQPDETELTEFPVEKTEDTIEDDISSDEKIPKSENLNDQQMKASDLQDKTSKEQLKFDSENLISEEEILQKEELIEDLSHQNPDSIENLNEEITSIKDEFEFSESDINLTENQHEKNKPGPDELLTFLTQKETDRIIETVFNDDHDDFVMTIEKITECSSYKEASEILKGVFFTYKVNPYIREAVALTNAVAKFFDQE
ncbi:MAG: hypothetical protein Kow0098_25490 [Ignavibacteriaceae bacterium]